MNREARRAAGPDALVLLGGPMANWVVKPDAPCLREGWHATWPPQVAAAWKPGSYVRVEGRRAAEWIEA